MSESKKKGSTTNGVGPVSSLAELTALAADESAVEVRTVYVPQWKKSVCLRAPLSSEADYYEQLTDRADEQGKPRIVENIRAELVARCLCDPEAPHPHLATDRAQITALAQQLAGMPSSVVRLLYGESRLVAGLVVTQAEVERAAGNSAGAPTADSGSGSPGSGAAPSASSAAAA